MAGNAGSFYRFYFAMSEAHRKGEFRRRDGVGGSPHSHKQTWRKEEEACSKLFPCWLQLPPPPHTPPLHGCQPLLQEPEGVGLPPLTSA